MRFPPEWVGAAAVASAPSFERRRSRLLRTSGPL